MHARLDLVGVIVFMCTVSHLSRYSRTSTLDNDIVVMRTFFAVKNVHLGKWQIWKDKEFGKYG
jgi:hypothetical protein